MTLPGTRENAPQHLPAGLLLAALDESDALAEILSSGPAVLADNPCLAAGDAAAAPDLADCYYRARYYDPRLGRFISEDPIGLDERDPNLYGYVGNDPVNYVDALGLERTNRPYGPPPTHSWNDFVYNIWDRWQGRATKNKDVGWRYAHCMASCETAKNSWPWMAKASGYANEARQVFNWARGADDGHSAWAARDFKDNETGYTCPANMSCEYRCKDLRGKNKTPSEYGPFYSGPR